MTQSAGSMPPLKVEDYIARLKNFKKNFVANMVLTFCMQKGNCKLEPWNKLTDFHCYSH